jgi:hypothetical protein
LKKLLVGMFLILSSTTFAQQPPAPPVKEYDLKLTMAEIQMIGTALVKRPYEEVAALLGKLNQQVTEQQKELPK